MNLFGVKGQCTPAAVLGRRGDLWAALPTEPFDLSNFAEANFGSKV